MVIAAWLICLAVPLALAFWFRAKDMADLRMNIDAAERRRLEEWRKTISVGSLVQFRTLAGSIVDDAEVVKINGDSGIVWVHSDICGNRTLSISRSAVYPPDYVFD